MVSNDILKELADTEEPLKYSRLLQLSGLSSEELADFKPEWSSVPGARKHEILAKLVELSENNLEFDFSGVFRVSLDDTDEHVREKATLGLWESDDRAVIRPLISLLNDDPSAKVRAAAGLTLRKFAALAQSRKLLPRDAERVQQALIAAISRDAEDLEVRRRAIEAVAYFEHPEIDDIIREAYASDNPRLKQSSLYAMGQSSNAEWLTIVIEETKNEDPAIRYEAVTACGLLGEESNVPHLVHLIQDEDLQVQLAALKALGEIGGPLAKRALQQSIKMGEEALNEVARDALTSIEFDEDPLGFKSKE